MPGCHPTAGGTPRGRRRFPAMDQLYFRCSTIAEDMPIDIAIDRQSLMRLRDMPVVLKCACGQTHEVKVAQLFQLAPKLRRCPLARAASAVEAA